MESKEPSVNSKHTSELITTIKLKKTTKVRLDHLRLYKRETYEEILQKMLEILNLCRIAPERARMKLIAIDKQKRKESKRESLPRPQKREEKA